MEPKTKEQVEEQEEAPITDAELKMLAIIGVVAIIALAAGVFLGFTIGRLV